MTLLTGHFHNQPGHNQRKNTRSEPAKKCSLASDDSAFHPRKQTVPCCSNKAAHRQVQLGLQFAVPLVKSNWTVVIFLTSHTIYPSKKAFYHNINLNREPESEIQVNILLALDMNEILQLVCSTSNIIDCIFLPLPFFLPEWVGCQSVFRRTAACALLPAIFLLPNAEGNIFVFYHVHNLALHREDKKNNPVAEKYRPEDRNIKYREESHHKSYKKSFCDCIPESQANEC